MSRAADGGNDDTHHTDVPACDDCGDLRTHPSVISLIDVSDDDTYDDDRLCSLCVLKNGPTTIDTAGGRAAALTRIDAIHKRLASRLIYAGITTIAELADAEIDTIETALGRSDSTATVIRNRARKLDPAYPSPAYGVELGAPGAGR